MAVPTAITDLSTTAASNSPAGSEAIRPDLDNYLRAAFAFIAQNYASLATKQASLGYTPVNRAGDTMTGQQAFTAGTAALPGIAFSGDTNTGIHSSGADTLDLVTAGAIQWRVDSSGRLRSVSNVQPGFAATRSTNQTSGTTIIFDTEARDVGAIYNNATGVFTAPVTGTYLVTFSASFYNTTGSAQSIEATMVAGGATVKSSDTAPDTSRCSLGASIVVYMTASDTTSVTITSLSASLYVLPGSSFSAVLLG